VTSDRSQGRLSKKQLNERAASIQLLVFDVDGVLTDGGLYYGPGGEALKRFDVRDGHGLVMARLAGLQAAVLTARSSQIVEVRGRELGLVEILQGKKNKQRALLELLEKLRVETANCAYMGDDVNDLGPLSVCGLPCCPADAAVEVRAKCSFVSRFKGGRGAARELVEICLKSKGSWDAVVELCNGVKFEPVDTFPPK
jgi:3-deoxy-D-manno-octulosonate 8-phosphate phosphatase (KDO 8-P phosphatase)